MAKTKGSDLAPLREIISARGSEFESSFIASLNPELTKLYKTGLPITWTPVEIQTELYVKAAEKLFPQDSNSLIKLGQAIAAKTFRGILKVFFMIPSLPFIIKKAKNVWRMYYDQGLADTEDVGNKKCTLVVRDFPDLPRKMREVICGHLYTILDLTGEKNGKITLDDRDANAWRWKVVWD
jgi:hypothetical protein